MALSDVYSQRGTITLAATTSTAVFSLYGTAAKRLWLVGVRVKILQTGAVAGNDVTFTLARPSATNTGTSLTSGVANANANAGVHLFAQATVATSTPVSYDFIWSE